MVTTTRRNCRGCWAVVTSVYAKGVGGRTMHSKADEPYEDEEEYDDAREIVEDADVAIVVSIFGTNDAKAVNWDTVKDDWVDEYKKFIEVFEALGATVIIGIPRALPGQ